MASLGALLLLIAFVTAAYAVAASVAGARRRNTRLIESGVGAFYTVAALMTVASGIITYAFVAGDYSIRYVQRYSDSVQPIFYKITSYWGGLDGSVMFWVFLLSCFGSVAVKVNRDRHRELIPYVVAVIGAVEMFFLFLMIIHNNPFATYLTESPTDGRAEPSLAGPALAEGARKHGATLHQNCAARGLDIEGGKVAGVITEHGIIRTRTVLLAGGAWRGGRARRGSGRRDTRGGRWLLQKVDVR